MVGPEGNTETLKRGLLLRLLQERLMSSGDTRAFSSELLNVIRTRRTWFDLDELRSSGFGDLLSEMENEGFARRLGRSVELLAGSRVAMVVEAIERGASLSTIEYLSPSEFEDFVSKLLEAQFFAVKTRMRLRDPDGGTEVDVVGWKRPRALYIDCKRWPRRTVYGTPCRKQVERVRKWGAMALKRMGATGNAKGFPIVATVIPGVERVVEGCILVGADKLGSAIHKISDGFLDEAGISIEI